MGEEKAVFILAPGSCWFKLISNRDEQNRSQSLGAIFGYQAGNKFVMVVGKQDPEANIWAQEG